MDVSKFPSHPPFSLGRAEPGHGGPRPADLPKAKFTVVAWLDHVRLVSAWKVH